MVHSSTHLALCWHLEQFLEDSLVWRTKPGGEEEGSGGGRCNGGGWLEGKKNRRQRFREQGGPSREALQRSHIVAILRQIPALRFESPVVEPEGARSLHRGCSGVEGDGEEQLPGDVMWPLSAVSEVGADEIFRVDWNGIPASADPLRGFGYKTPAPTKRKSSRRRQSHGGGHDDDESGEGEEGRLARGARKRSQVESIATALKLLNLPTGICSTLRIGSAFLFMWNDQLRV
jgi:hypothetical protein